MNEARKTPWHLWVIGLVTLVWNAFGAWDYTATQTGNVAYLQTVADSMNVDVETAMAYFQGWPTWFHAFWAFGVWGALLGSLLLLLRSRFAVWSFAISLLGLAVTSAYQASVDKPEWATSTATSMMTIVIWSIAVFLLIYAVSMKSKGVLR